MNYKRIALSLTVATLALVCGGSAVADKTNRADISGQKVVRSVQASEAEIAAVGKSLREAAAAGRRLSAEDEKWLSVLRRYWGRDSITVPDLDRLPATRTVPCSLSVEYINSHKGALQSLVNAWNAMEAATYHEASIFKGEGYSVPCHNPEILAMMRQSYTSEEFLDLYDLLLNHGVFVLKVNHENGLVTTSDIDGAENHEMACRQWVTDTVRTGELERMNFPKDWKRVLNTLAAYYTSETEQKAFDRCIKDPQIYREGGLEEGVAHIFYPNTLQRDPGWFNNKRLESHGLALQAFCGGILAVAEDKDWAVHEPGDDYVQAMANLAAYLISIDYSTAPSAGNWEETPFPGGLTWDSEAIRKGLHDLNTLLFDEHLSKYPAVTKFRKRLRQAKHADIITDRVRLAHAIVDGEKRLRKHYLAESPGAREMDSSLGFMAASDFQLDDDVLCSVSMYLDQLTALEDKLVRDNGMLRYAPFAMSLKDGSKMSSPDSYLTLNYNIACDSQGKINLEWKGVLDSFGSKDCSEPKVFAARASLATPDREAEWFMVSDLACGYAHQANIVLQAAAHRLGRPNYNTTSRVYDTTVFSELTTSERALVERALAGATRNINRAYARVTGPQDNVKANGMAAPAWAVPEAWQSVSRLDGGVGYLPGVNTPLTWAAVSLWRASKEYLELLVNTNI